MNSRFSKRSALIEIMDDLQCQGEVVNQTLKELEVINTWLGGNEVTLGGVIKLIRKSKQSSILTIVDIGCGGGDMLREIARWGRKKNLKLKLTGIDANPNIVEFARKNTNDYPEITYQAQNIFSDDFTHMKADIIVATLFFHHFESDKLVALLRTLQKQVTHGIVINDLQRHWFAYYSIKFLTQLFSKSEMVKYDAPVSVLRAFSRKDLITILQKAGISNYTLSWKWAFRWQLVMPRTLA